MRLFSLHSVPCSPFAVRLLLFQCDVMDRHYDHHNHHRYVLYVIRRESERERNKERKKESVSVCEGERGTIHRRIKHQDHADLWLIFFFCTLAPGSRVMLGLVIVLWLWLSGKYLRILGDRSSLVILSNTGISIFF